MTKSQPQVKIVNCETGEEIVRDANDQEIAQMEVYAAEEVARQAKEVAKAQAKEELLKRLGITAEEAQLLLGGN
jgi:hypothetical protein